MTIQREGLLVQESNISPVDLELFESFQAAHLDTTDVYEQMTPTKERKQAGMDALRRGENADFSVQENEADLDATVIAERLNTLQQWKRDLIADTTLDADIKQVYRWKVNEDIANLHMLEASRVGDMRNFRRWNEFIYGKLDEDVYRASLDWVAHDAEKLLASADHQKPAVQEAAQNVLNMLEGERGYRELLAPDEETFNAVREDHMREGGYYALLLAGVNIPENGKISNEEGDRILAHVVRHNLESDYEAEDSPGAAWSVVHGRRKYRRPKAYNMVVKRFQGLGLGHEIGTHLLERMNGMRGPVRLMSRGLDRTELGGEGRAVVREIVPYESFDEFGKLVRWRDILRRDIAIGYGSGIGQDEPRTSQEIYQFMKTIDTMYQAKLTPDDAEVIEEKAHQKSGDLLAGRILRGVDGFKGGVYFKDKVYAEGHVDAWLMAALHGPQAISDGDLGKYAISNLRHIAFLQKMGVLPKV
jgi:hypothetical protein